MATFVWHGETSGVWNTGSNWLVGGVQQTSPPTSADDVTFDNNAHTYAITTSATISAKSIDTSGTTNNVSLSLGTRTINLYGNLTLKSGDNFALGVTSILGNCVISQNGATLSFPRGLTLNTTGRTISLGSAISASGTFTIKNGTLDLSAYDNSVIGGVTDGGGSSAHSLILGSRTVTMTGALSITGSNFSIDSANHNLTVRGDITISPSSSWGIINYQWSGSLGGASQAINLGSGVTLKQFNIDCYATKVNAVVTFNSNVTVSESSSWYGGKPTHDDPTYRLIIRSNTIGTARTFSFSQAGQTLTMQDVDLRDITISSTNSPTVTSTRVGDCGGNTNINASTPKTVYINGASSNVSWYSDIWSIISTTGATSLNNAPLPQDTVIMDDDSFDALVTITCDRQHSYPTLDFSTLTEAQVIKADSGMTCYGPVNMGAGQLGGIDSIGDWLFISNRTRSGTMDIAIGNLAGNCNLGLDLGGCFGSTVRLTKDFAVRNDASLVIGNNGTTLDLNGHTVTFTTATLGFTGASYLTDSAGGGKLVIKHFGTTQNYAMSLNPSSTFSNNISIEWNPSSAVTQELYLWMRTNATVLEVGDITIKKHAGNYNICLCNSSSSSYDPVKCQNLTIEAPDGSTYNRVAFSSAGTTEIVSLTARATATRNISLLSRSGSQATISDASGTNICSYCTITNLAVTGGATWDASDHCTDNGGNSGWTWFVTHTLTASLDALLQNTGVGILNLDAILTAQTLHTTTASIDALLQSIQTKQALLDALLQTAGLEKTASFDALLQSGKTKTAVIDAILKSTGKVKTALLDALLQTTGKTRTAVLDALLQVSGKTKTLTVDALLQKLRTGSVSLDAVLQALATTTVTLNIDTVLKKLATTQSVSLDALLKALAKTKTVSVDALLQKGHTGSVSLDSLLRAARSCGTSVDALLKALKSLGVSLDAVLIPMGQKTANTSLDALLKKAKNIFVSIDALLAAVHTNSASLDALLARGIAKTASLDALLRKAKQRTVSIDAVLRTTMSISLYLDALLQKARSSNTVFDAVLVAISVHSKVVSLDAMLAASILRTVMMDAMLRKQIAAQVNMDALLFALGEGIVAHETIGSRLKTSTVRVKDVQKVVEGKHHIATVTNETRATVEGKKRSSTVTTPSTRR